LTAFLLALPTFHTGEDFGLTLVTRAVVLDCSVDLLGLASGIVLLAGFLIVVVVDGAG
jgi:hypothetical protein